MNILSQFITNKKQLKYYNFWYYIGKNSIYIRAYYYKMAKRKEYDIYYIWDTIYLVYDWNKNLKLFGIEYDNLHSLWKEVVHEKK
jgi:hypothetical protein